MRNLKAIALDVDGVLTDGTFWWGLDGEEYKRFSFRDVMGVSLAMKAGLVCALISAENNPLVHRYAAKMGITDIWDGCKDKAAALQAFADRHHFDLHEVAFMGDDVNDLKALALAGFSAAPADAHPSVKQAVKFVSQYPGGHGAVREVVDLIMG